MLSVVIATYNRLEKLERCIRTFCETHRGKLDYEVIVSLDGGPHVEETKAIAEKYSAKFVHLTTNSGCGHANNAGILAASAQSDCVAVVNDDVWFEEAACAKLCEILRGNQNIGIVSARLLYPDGTVQHAGLDARILHIGRGLPGDHPLAQESRDAVSVTSALMVFSRRLLDAARGFDVRYRMGYEDIDICFRARELGWLTHYCGSAWAFHDEGGTRGKSESLLNNKAWCTWDAEGRNIFFNTWSSSGESFCYDSVTFVVVSTGQPVLQVSLTALQKQMSSRDDVVVVDSSQSSEVPKIVEGFGSRFRYFACPYGSPAEKLNLGLKHATGCSITFCVEGDVYAESSVQLIKNAIREHPLTPMLFKARRMLETGGVIPQMLLIPNCPDFIPAWNQTLDFDSEASAAFARDVASSWPGNIMLQQDIHIA